MQYDIPRPWSFLCKLSICEHPTQGLDPVEPESWYNKKKCTDKNGVDGLDFVENAESDLTHVCDFVEPPPLFHFVSTNPSWEPHHPNFRGVISTIVIQHVLI